MSLSKFYNSCVINKCDQRRISEFKDKLEGSYLYQTALRDDLFIESIMINYYRQWNSTAYIIYDTININIVRSRTIEFFESTPGNTYTPNNIPKIYNFEKSFKKEHETYMHDYN
ncbi:hypothetical protein H8356DRAFT_1329512 [Neocallimastix lanati (nom. inval.)]|nr:hypothetical protein H8356DRAFT_1329512 [Neocallimastix sp. JGI-2020a]